MIGNTLEAVVAIRFLAHEGDRPKHLLATAEFVLYFGGKVPDMKVTGIALWRGESESTVTLTLPAGPGNAGEYYCFRPVSGEIRDLIQFKGAVITAYRAWVAGQGDGGVPGSS